jgi:starch phosphorylase
MEIALEPGIPTYSGGLGILAGDTLRSAADRGLPMVAVTLVHRNGYFRQAVSSEGIQHEEPSAWEPESRAVLLPLSAKITIEQRQVEVRIFRYDVTGATGHVVPVYLLDTNVETNDAGDRGLTDWLYGGDERYRLCQEAVLGLGAVGVLRNLSYDAVSTYHMNEGHSALAVIALLEQYGNLEAVRERCSFTTHTPVPAGHDSFDLDLARGVLGDERVAAIERIGGVRDGRLNMSLLALSGSHYINAVSLRHGEVTQKMFPKTHVAAITNGVHAATWMSPGFQDLLDRCAPEWRYDNAYLRYALKIPLDDVAKTHARAKAHLLSEIRRRTETRLDQSALTVGFARRTTEYKRPHLIFSDLDRLRALAHAGPLQLVFAGKAHPRDGGAKYEIQRIFEAAAALRDSVGVVFVENYDWELGALLVAGVDVWLNNPRAPLEASGTSGMKAALNGVPSLSTLDGWWIEGHIEGVTGWAIGGDAFLEGAQSDESDATALYEKLQDTVMPLFYQDPAGFARVRRSALALNGSFFNTDRMIVQYALHAYGGLQAVPHLHALPRPARKAALP